MTSEINDREAVYYSVSLHVTKMACTFGGYDCRFVEEPPDDLICLICTFVAKDPQQVTCCGRIYCRACLVEQKKHSSICPQCRKSGTSFEDKRSNRAIKQLKAKCNNNENGCKWSGVLDEFNNHLKICPYQLGKCLNHCTNHCTKDNKPVELLRKYMGEHLQSHCPYRIIQCAHCKKMGMYVDITTRHLATCPKVKIPCTNRGCMACIPRDMLFNHRLKDCPFEIIHCKYFHIGCTTELLRKDRESHEQNKDELHLDLTIDTITKMRCGLASTSTNQNGFTFKMSSFENHKTKDMGYYSPPFYTKPGGYKMCICVDANGWRDGYKKSVSVFVYFMRGENDDNLAWPFTGKVTITLLNQLQDNYHKSVGIKYTKDEDDDAYKRVTKGDRAETGYGSSSIISHNDLHRRLNCQYLKDDCLFFRVTVTVLEQHHDNISFTGKTK